jgi:CheY-like chemotaxis protein
MPRILVLEDEVLISFLLCDWLAELGCETVGPVNSVVRALDLISNALPDGAILDVSVGGENSYPVAAALRSKGVPFAFATGRAACDVTDLFQDALMLPKPFDFEGVRRVMAEMLQPDQLR